MHALPTLFLQLCVRYINTYSHLIHSWSFFLILKYFIFNWVLVFWVFWGVLWCLVFFYLFVLGFFVVADVGLFVIFFKENKAMYFLANNKYTME